MTRTALHIGVVLLAICAVAPAQETRADRMDLEGFGKLPVRFNSRVTTFAHFARNTILRLADRDSVDGTDGQPLDPVRWVLDLAAGRPEALEVPILPIEGEEVFRLVRPDAKPGKRVLISVSEFQGCYRRVEDAAREAGQVPRSEQTEAQEAISRLIGSAWSIADLRSSLEVARGNSIQTAADFDRVRGDAVVPLTVPPEKPGEPWRTLSRASLDVLAAETIEGRSAGSVARAMIGIVRAYSAGDAGVFAEQLAEYRRLLDELGTGATPIRYDVPEAWIEVGVAMAPRDWFYGDAGTRGSPMARFAIREGSETAWVNANHFPEGLPDTTCLVNQWRLQHGMPPLDPDGVGKSLRPFPVGPLQGKRVELETPGSLPLDRTTTVSVSLDHPGGTSEISIYGPAALVRRHLPEYESFAASFRFGRESEVRAWLAAEQGVPSPTFEGMSFLGAVLPRAGRLWVLRTTCLSECAAAHREEFVALARGARFSFWSRDPVRFELPEGMREVRGTGSVYAEIHGDVETDGRKHPHWISVEPIASADPGGLPRVVNLWRGYLGLAPASASELEKMIRPLDTQDEAAGFLVEFSGPARADPLPRIPAPTAPEAPEIDFDVPAGWRAVEPGALQIASLTYVKDGEKLAVGIFHFPGTVGGVHANVNRFRSQVGLDEPLTREKIDESLRPVTVLGKPGQAFEVIGERLAVLGAFVPDEGATWVVRMKGPSVLATGQRAALLEFLGSLRLKER